MSDLTTMHEIVGESGEPGEGCMAVAFASLLAIVGSFAMFWFVWGLVT